MSTDAGARWRSEHVDSAHFYINKDIDKLIQDTENTFISELEDGNRQKAMKRLRVPPLGDKQSPWTTFKVYTTFPCNLGSPIQLYDTLIVIGWAFLWRFRGSPDLRSAELDLL